MQEEGNHKSWQFLEQASRCTELVRGARSGSLGVIAFGKPKLYNLEVWRKQWWWQERTHKIKIDPPIGSLLTYQGCDIFCLVAEIVLLGVILKQIFHCNGSYSETISEHCSLQGFHINLTSYQSGVVCQWKYFMGLRKAVGFFLQDDGYEYLFGLGEFVLYMRWSDSLSATG